MSPGPETAIFLTLHSPLLNSSSESSILLVDFSSPSVYVWLVEQVHRKGVS